MFTKPSRALFREIDGNFWKFWSAYTISQFGSSFTTFIFPLIIYKITGSAINLALATAVTFLPYLLFGLIIGAWVDRTNRKWVMISADLCRALLVASVPTLSLLGILSVWYIFIVMFVSSTLAICYSAAQNAAIPCIVERHNLLKANGLTSFSYSSATVVGPILASILITILPLEMLLFFDALSFLSSLLLVASISANLNPDEERRRTHLRQDIQEGLTYVLEQPVLRNLSMMVGALIFVGSTIDAQLVLYAKNHLLANDSQVGLLYSAGGIGFIIFSLAAAPLRKFYSFNTMILGTCVAKSLFIIGLGLTPWYWGALILWGLIQGMTMLFVINTTSLRQTIVPNNLMGRVVTIAQVISWSAIPLGTSLGGLAIEQTQNVGFVYATIGVLHLLITCGFIFSPLSYMRSPVTAKTAAHNPEEVNTTN